MSAIELAVLGLQAATLAALIASLVAQQGRSRGGSRFPAHVDLALAGPSAHAGLTTRVEGWDADGRLGALRVEVGGGARLYEVWALSRAGWVQLHPEGDRWSSPLMDGERARALRLWLDRPGRGPVDTRPARAASPMLIAAALVLARSSSEARAPARRPTWADDDDLVEGLLDDWTEAVLAANRSGWPVGLPTGEALFEASARAGASADAPSFARWLVGELGRATRVGLERAVIERREPAARRLFVAAGRLLRGIDEALELEVSPPAGVGPRQRETWLVDDALARALDNPPVREVVQPIVVLRPALRHRGTTLLEGEVA